MSSSSGRLCCPRSRPDHVARWSVSSSSPSRSLVCAAKGKANKADKGPKTLLPPDAGAAPKAQAPTPHLSPLSIFHALNLIDSHLRIVGTPLLPVTAGTSIEAAPTALFEAAAVVVSHNTQTPPVFNYGNAAALSLWGLSWHEFTALPSERSAADDTDVQSSRKKALEAAKAQGVVREYSGVRVTSTGRRFQLEDAVLWTIVLPKGEGLDSTEQDGIMADARRHRRTLSADVAVRRASNDSVNLGVVFQQAATFSEITWLDPGSPGNVGERWRCVGGPDGGWEAVPSEAAEPVPQPAPPVAKISDVAAMRAAAEAQGDAVRALKAAGAAKDDPELVAAVEKLLVLKAQLAAAEAE